MPRPSRPWVGRMRWSDLAFLHWPVAAEALQPLVPRELEIETFNGTAWLGIVPFRMEGVRLRGAPPVPTAHAFPEVNVRTYGRAGDRSGVWFFSLDAASRLAVRGARMLYNLPYYDADISVTEKGNGIEYHSRRLHQAAPAAELSVVYAPVSAPSFALPGTLDHFLVERYRLFSHSERRGLGYLEIDHHPWPLQRAAATVAINTMTRPLGLSLPATAPVVHFARSLEVVAWSRRPAEPRR